VRIPLLALAVALSGCATVIPLQTASTVPPHAFRLGAQATLPGYCTFSLAPQNCTESIGTIALPFVPELRASARMGVTPWADAGASVHGLVRSSMAVVGGLLDAKARFLQMPMGAGELIGSGGLGLGVTAGLPIAGSGLPGLTQVEIAVPLFFGYRRGGVEWIASPRLVDRMRFADIDGDGQREVLSVIEPGIALGVVGGGAWKWSVQIEYHAPIDYLADGPILLGIGFLFDVGMAPRETDEPEADTLEDGGTP
jgi:uncharacterized protein YceK